MPCPDLLPDQRSHEGPAVGERITARVQSRLTRSKPTVVVVVIPLDTDLADARYHRAALRLLAQWWLRSAVTGRPRTAW
jgi:hypothetical protein